MNAKPTTLEIAKDNLSRGPMTLTAATEQRFWRAYNALVLSGYAAASDASARGSVVFTKVSA